MVLEAKAFYDFGRFSLRTIDRVLLTGDMELSLSPKAFELLQHFLMNPGALVTREQLKLSVWGTANISDNSIDQKIAELRKVFAQADPSAEYIQNKHGQGWRFVAAVVKRTEPAAEALTPGADSVAEPARARRLVRSKMLYALVAATAAITAGAVVKIEAVRESEPRVTDYRQLTSDGLPKEGRVLTDGRLVYFTEHISYDADSDTRLAAAPVSGGEVMYPPTPVQPAVLFDIAAQTGDRLYCNSALYCSGPTFVWRSKESSLEPTETENDPGSLSPDGHTLTYGDQNRDHLSIRDLAGPSTVRIVPVRGHAESPRWSIDGKRIRFSVFDPVSMSSSLWEVRRDGRNLHQLAIPTGQGKRKRPDGWTPDGRYFIYSEYSTLDRRSSLWIVADDPLGIKRTKPVRLAGIPIDFRSSVAAPDGSALFAIGTKVRNELVRFDLQTREFVPMWEGLSPIDVAFSNDGAWAAFARYPECTLWVIRSNGSDRRQITWPTMEVHQPHWSPDGTRIAFMGRMPGKPWRIYTVNAAGGVPREVKPDDPLDQGVPSWSADGNSLVFGELRERNPDSEMVIRILDLATSVETVLPGSKGKWSPRWSPDGRSILAQTTDFKALDLFDCETQTWRRLTRGSVMNDASWSLDGKFVHFQAATERGDALFRVRIDDGKVEQLALQPEFEYSWSGVAPDGSPLTLRSVRIEEIYALDLRLP
jgi:Tol biopolymer transport system component/DNA-binding winged helix-turn-helix (wHTH) protein